MKNLIQKILKNKYIKLSKQNKIYKKQLKELKEELEKVKKFNIELQKTNYEISSNNEYLLEQIKKYKKKNRSKKNETKNS